MKGRIGVREGLPEARVARSAECRLEQKMGYGRHTDHARDQLIVARHNISCYFTFYGVGYVGKNFIKIAIRKKIIINRMKGNKFVSNIAMIMAI